MVCSMEYGWSGFCRDFDGLFSKTLLKPVLRENLGGLSQFLHMSRLCNLTDKCSAQTLLVCMFLFSVFRFLLFFVFSFSKNRYV